jgi:SAM-dependent methyltransferase
MGDGYGTAEERYVDLSGRYDDLHPFDADGEATVSFLEKLAPGGRALELAVGTGRIAIPLAERGCAVTGVDASPDMLAILRSKDPAERVRAVRTDMAAPDLSGEFDLVYVVANSLFELRTQREQLSCLRSAAGLLCGGGSLVIEAAVPNMLFADRRPIFVGRMDELNAVSLQAMHYDSVNQIIQYRHIFIANDSIRVLPTTHRFVYLPELDLMAELAGLEFASRHSDWFGGPFDPATGRHISVYTKPTA